MSIQFGQDVAFQRPVVISGALTASGGVSVGNQRITSVATPTAGTDAATKSYVDNVAGSNDPLVLSLFGVC